MAQETSVEAYANIVASGQASDIRAKVLDVVSTQGPITQGETWNEHFPEKMEHAVTPRFAELKNAGLIASYGKRKCRYSKVTCMTWELVRTGNAISTVENVPVKKTIKQLESDVHLLEARLRNEQESNTKYLKLIEDLRAEIDDLHRIEKEGGR